MPKNHVSRKSRCQVCKQPFPTADLRETGWGTHCLPCRHDTRMAGSAGYREQAAKEGVHPAIAATMAARDARKGAA